MNVRQTKLWLHIVLCIFFLSLPILFSPDLSTGKFIYMRGFWRDAITYALMIVFFYASYYFILPQFFYKKKYVLFGLSILLFFALFVFLPGLVFPDRFHRTLPAGAVQNFPFRRESIYMRELRHHLFHFAAVLIFSFLLKIYHRWKKAEQEKINAELSYLKAQVNPHFLFNTLNSIYSLALDKSDNTAPAIVKLSGLMRYVITESGKDFVSLEKEINYIRDFIDLQKIRLGDTAAVEVKITGSAGSKKIAPLLMIPFVENAFKYGVNPEEDAMIRIEIVMEERVTMIVSNNKVRTTIPKEAKSGLGIKNTRERLELLYPGMHLLDINNSAKEFIVKLQIDVK